MDFDATCINGVGQTHVVTSGTLLQCDTIRVEGTFVVQSDTRIETKRILVLETGTVVVGNETTPARNVTIHLHHDNCQDNYPIELETHYWDQDSSSARACLQDGTILVNGNWTSHGLPKTTWTLLTQDADASELVVEQCDGWSVGDRIVVAPNAGRTNRDQTHAPTRRIVSIDSSCARRPRPTAHADALWPVLPRRRRLAGRRGHESGSIDSVHRTAPPPAPPAQTEYKGVAVRPEAFGGQGILFTVIPAAGWTCATTGWSAADAS